MLWNSRACIVVVIETRLRIVSILQPKPPYMYIEDWCRRIGQMVSSWKEKRGICDTRMAVCPTKWFKGLTYQMGYKKHNRPPWPSNPYLAMVYGARTRLETSQKDLQLMQKGDVEETILHVVCFRFMHAKKWEWGLLRMWIGLTTLVITEHHDWLAFKKFLKASIAIGWLLKTF